MESTNHSEENKLVDFESDIDTWIIDKEDIGLSTPSDAAQDKPKNDCRSVVFKNMNKENIKKNINLSDRKALRCFRIKKSMGCQGTISDSESDAKRKSSDDVIDHSYWNKKRRLEASKISNEKISVEPKLQRTSSASSLSDSSSFSQEIGSLNSKEISIMLTNMERTCQESTRERLHSIENVSSLVESKDKGGDGLPTYLKFECSVCNCEFHSLEELQCHENMHKRKFSPMISHHAERLQNQVQTKNLQNADTTWNRTEFLDNFTSHLVNGGTTTPLKVNCNISCFSKNSAEDILKKSQSETKFECGMCKFNCSELLTHKSHQILCHSDKSNLVCEYCNYKTSLCSNLAKHIQIHFQFNCPHCEYQCKLKASLDSHLLLYHSEKKYYKCDKCKYSCKSRGKFQKHVQLHKTTNKYQCEECKLFFATKQTLKSHILKHSIQMKTYKCTECELKFSKKYHLKLHMKSHEQLYICDTCNCKFKQKNFLKVHMKVHSQESLKCKKCNSIFSRKNYLKLHMRIHVPKYSKCEHCPFKSTNPSDLSKHICINKLYAVQKRSLNFQKDDNVNDVKISTTSSKCIKQEKSNVFSLISNSDTNIKKQIREMQVKETVVKKRPHIRKKFNKNSIRVSSLRQNLPSRKSQNSVEEKYRTHNNINSCSKQKPDINKPRNTKHGKNPNLKVLKKSYAKHNNWVLKNKQANLNSQNKNYKVFESLNIFKELGLFDDKLSSTKHLLVEPVMLTNENYVECYYLSQQSTVQDHVDRHLRQNNLLSCRFCQYKTNSNQLLQRHTATKHTWDPARLSEWFS